MKHLDLFSGIGGFALAASWVWGDEHDIHSFVEIEPFCQKVLKKHWPQVPIHSDIKDYKHDGTTIDLLTGGFPCQPFSTAGGRNGQEDDRYLWPSMLETIQEVEPTWIIGENVNGIKSMGFRKMLSELESINYNTQCFNIPACGVGAPTYRPRVWIVANNRSHPDNIKRTLEKGKKFMVERRKDNEFKIWRKFYRTLELAVRSRSNETLKAIFCGNCNGISRKLDKSRIKALGNAIVPQVVVPIMQAIKQIEKKPCNPNKNDL